MYIIIAIIAFGLLIAVHELGHFTSAKLLGVRVNEFAIGMGPKLLKKQGKETLYTLRALPFGGFCAMGEDDEPEDERSFPVQKHWKRVVILASGAIANLIAAFIIVVIVVFVTIGVSDYLAGTMITGFFDGFPLEGANGLMAGDTVVAINGEKLYYVDDFALFMGLYGDAPVDMKVRRNGELITINDLPLEKREYITESGSTWKYGLYFNSIKNTFGEKLKYSCYLTANYVRIVRISLIQLFSGKVSVREMSGPVGIVDVMNDIGRSSASIGIAIVNIASTTALIGANLAVMNLLPIPALDGGRILFLLINWVIEKVTRRRVNPKYEGYIHTTAMVLLLGFMVFILINDVVKIVSG